MQQAKETGGSSTTTRKDIAAHSLPPIGDAYVDNFAPWRDAVAQREIELGMKRLDTSD